MSDALADLERLVSGLTGAEKAELDKLIADELGKAFLPNPGPQTQALLSLADILLYGGQAGGGKSALEVGAFFDGHYSGICFRREGTQLDGLIEFCKTIGDPAHGKFVGGNENVFKRNDGGRLKFAGLNQADDWRKHAGNARDLMVFDEAAEFLREQVMSLLGWLRSTRPGQRCRMILGSNPPRGGDGEWLIEEFAPWLDPLYSGTLGRAKPGGLRWAIIVAGKTEWVEGPGEYTRSGEPYEAMSRTFIPASLSDNPYLSGDGGYRARLQALPEPLRSQLLYGDFLAGREDHEWQVIPTAWVKAANDRWTAAQPKRRAMIALSADVFGGGKDGVAIAKLHEENWFAPIVTADASAFSDPTMIPVETAAMMLRERRDGADLSIDATGGWGSGVRSTLKKDHDIDCAPIVFSAKSEALAKGTNYGFYNLRAEIYWRFREALDPDSGEDIMLPPDPVLTAELTAPRYILKKMLLLIEEKAEIIARVGHSPDRADATVMAWRRRGAAIRAIAAKTKTKTAPRGPSSSSSWMN